MSADWLLLAVVGFLFCCGIAAAVTWLLLQLDTEARDQIEESTRDWRRVLW